MRTEKTDRMRCLWAFDSFFCIKCSCCSFLLFFLLFFLIVTQWLETEKIFMNHIKSMMEVFDTFGKVSKVI